MTLKKTLLTLGLAASCALPLQSTQAEGIDALGILSLAAGILNQGVFPTSEAYTTDDDIIIHASDGVEIAANIFVPTAIEAGELAPAVIFINSWAMNEYEYVKQAGVLAEQGYIVLSYSTRGFGQSGGMINTGGPKDMDDLSRVIDYLISHYQVNPEAIGAAGISYGSGISLLGAAHDSRIKAVSAMSSWGSLIEALYGNNTPRLVWGELLTTTGDLIGNLDPIVNQHWDNLSSQNLEAIPEIIAWGNERSPVNFVDEINANGTAIYLGKAYGDVLFQPNSLMDMFSQLTVPKLVDLVPGTHATPDLIPSLLGIGEDTYWDHTYQWFDLHLKGQTNELAHAKPVQMKVKFQDRTEGFDDFPISQATTETYYLHPRGWFDDGDLEDYAYSGSAKDNSYNTWLGSILETGIPLLSEMLAQFDVKTQVNIPLAADSNSVYYKTNRLNDTMQIRGNPSVNLSLQPHAQVAQIFAYLYDMDAFGTGTLITHGAYTLPQVNDKETVNVDIELVTTAYDIPAGHRLVIAFDSKDIEYKSVTSSGYRLDIEFNRNQQNLLHVPTL